VADTQFLEGQSHALKADSGPEIMAKLSSSFLGIFTSGDRIQPLPDDWTMARSGLGVLLVNSSHRKVKGQQSLFFWRPTNCNPAAMWPRQRGWRILGILGHGHRSRRSVGHRTRIGSHGARTFLPPSRPIPPLSNIDKVFGEPSHSLSEIFSDSKLLTLATKNGE
jgi:hypothetical protein